ncbi:T-complex protein 11-domain-containing protein [Halenospora varia]|nr:T-complex protein 11-domain-containing protein [Halenospora varia]
MTIRHDKGSATVLRSSSRRLPNHKTGKPAKEPPVTAATLSELDVNKIVNNPKLRHDINFDPDLHFRPNLDGEKKRKIKIADDFWETMRLQLREYRMQPEQFERGLLGDTEWCLPETLKAIRGILEILVPQRDRVAVEEMFNIEMLMQQFQKGAEKLAAWLSQLLKCHCAPMRDSWVDEMATQLSNGDRNGDVTLLVAGMQNLLGVLEAMKLDTVHFEQKFFMKKIAAGIVDVTAANAWFRRASSLPDIAPTGSSPHTSEMVPHTFLFDEERLTKLRSDMLNLINLEICMCLYRNLHGQSNTTPENTPMTSVLSFPTIPEPHHFAPKPKQIPQDGHVVTSASPSPRSSPSSTASTPDTYSLTPLRLSLPFDHPTSQVRTLLLAILSSSTTNDKCTSLLPSLALQILHSTTTPLTHLRQIESDLTLHLSNPRSRVYQEAETHVLNQLGPVLKKLVINYTSLTSLQIFEAATLPGTPPTPENRPKDEISEIAKRIAHIGILHWRVWGPLAYVLNPKTEEEIEVPKERAQSIS